MKSLYAAQYQREVLFLVSICRNNDIFLQTHPKNEKSHDKNASIKRKYDGELKSLENHPPFILLVQSLSFLLVRFYTF